MAAKIDVAKLMADLAAQKQKLLEKQKEQQAAAAVSSTATKSEPKATTTAAASSSKVPENAADVKSRIGAQLAMHPKLAAIVGAIPATPVVQPHDVLRKQKQQQAQAANTPKPLLLDAQGREIDEKGNLVQFTARQASSLANQKEIEKERRKRGEQRAREMLAGDAAETTLRGSFVDPRMKANRAQRVARPIHFVQPGTFVKKAEKMRDIAVKEELKAEANSVAATRLDPLALAALEREAAMFDNPNLVQLGASRPTNVRPPVPDVEWWDVPFVVEERSYQANIVDEVAASSSSAMKIDQPSTTSDTRRFKVREDRITQYIEHPLPVRALVAPKPPPPLQVMLTETERKRLRKRQRAERLAEQKERVMLGLEPPPPPRVRLQNLMKVKGKEAVLDPTAVEAQVRREMAARAAAHDARNHARMLTPAQRKDKKRRKLVEDTAAGVHSAVYAVRDLSHPQRRFKVDATARTLHLTGSMIIAPKFSLVVVEGGPKALQKFKKLMLRRIDWKANIAIRSKSSTGGEDDDNDAAVATTTSGVGDGAAGGDDADADDDDDDDDKQANDGAANGDEEEEDDDDDDQPGDAQKDCSTNECAVAWEGMLAARNFKNWNVETAQTERAAQFVLRQHNCEQYYNIAEAALTSDSFGSKTLFNH